MLVFDDDETVIDAQAGFPRGWTVTKSDNRVGVSPNPIAQPVTDASGNNVSQLFLPTAKDWKTNLFVVTSKRDYSPELNVLDKDSPAGPLLSATTIPMSRGKSQPPPAPPASNDSRKYWTGSG